MVTTNKQIDRKLFKMKRSGMSAESIAERLNAEGIKTARGLKWTRGNVSNRLYSPKEQKRVVAEPDLIGEVLRAQMSKQTKIALLAKLI